MSNSCKCPYCDGCASRSSCPWERKISALWGAITSLSELVWELRHKSHTTTNAICVSSVKNKNPGGSFHG